MGKASAPPAPDYEAAARETAAGNMEAARMATQANRPNQYTPWGSSTWTNAREFDQAGYNAAMNQYNQAMAARQQPGGYNQSGSVDEYGRIMLGDLNDATRSYPMGEMPALPDRASFYGGDNWSQTVTLSPETQALFDQSMALERGLFNTQNQALGRVNQTLGQGFDMSGVPQGGTTFSPTGQALSVYDPNLQTNNAQELLMRRLAPEMDRNSESLRAQLANQGIVQGSQAYANAMDQMNRQRNDLSTQAALQGIGLGMQQQGLQFSQGLQNRGLLASEQAQQFGQSEAARARAMQERAFLRSLPMNEFNALRSGTQVSMPQFGGFAQQATTGGPDILGAANAGYQAQLGGVNAQNAGTAGMLGGLFGIGGTLLGAPSSSVIGGLFGLGGAGG